MVSKRVIQEQLEEDKLAIGLMHKNTAAFEQLYIRFSPVLYGLIVKWVRDEGIAAQLLQDVFVKAWNNSGQYDPLKGRLFLWMYKISRNLSVDYLRSKAHRMKKLCRHDTSLLQYLQKEHQDSFSPDYIGLRSVLKRLSKAEREIIELIYFEGYTQAQAAQCAGIPVGTVKTRCARGLKRLRDFFIQDAGAAASFTLV